MKQYKNIHFIGIGGIGISALAYLALEEGKKVSGSDSVASALTDDLIEKGAHMSIGHDENYVDENTELVIYTEAIDKKNNPEYLRALDLGIPTLSYFEALGQISRTKKTIAVIGTHGKTTTTAMLGLALIECGFDPLVIVGSKVREFDGKNIKIGKGDLFAVEGCEYRRSFLSLSPFGIVFLNCELDHMDYYRDESDYLNAYEEMIKKIPSDGFLMANMDDKNVSKLSRNCAGAIIGIHQSDVDKLDLRPGVFGEFNRFNATQAYKAVEVFGGKDSDIRQAIESFNGTWRRMEHKGEFNGAVLIDDYGHHPTELKLTLKAIKDRYPNKRLICVFQPHQHSRTHLLIDEFKTSFSDADKVIITNIYEARDSDDDKLKMNGEKFAQILSENHSDVMWGNGLDNTYNMLKDIVQKDDVLVIMGAGDIGDLAERLSLG